MELVVAKYFSFRAVRLVGRDHFTISVILNEAACSSLPESKDPYTS